MIVKNDPSGENPMSLSLLVLEKYLSQIFNKNPKKMDVIATKLDLLWNFLQYST